MAARPTAIQEGAMRAAINSDRIGDATTYADRTLEVMVRNGWITRPDGWTYRVTEKAALVLGLYALADSYRDEDLLGDPKAQRQARVVKLAQDAGVNAFVTPISTETVSIGVEDLAQLLSRINS